ncbi:MAG TPA: YggT family protein [Candidatus Paceibacterota bacterium]|nr:YggT family protein [Candidatus Paceibacterota bacterium]
MTTTTYVSHTTPAVKPLYRGTQIVWYVFSVVEALLLLRFFLKLIGANAGAGFTQFIYSVTYPLVAPFLFVVGSPAVNGNVFEWTTLLALFVYWLLAWGIVRLLAMGRPVSTTEAQVKLTEQDVV